MNIRTLAALLLAIPNSYAPSVALVFVPGTKRLVTYLDPNPDVTRTDRRRRFPKRYNPTGLHGNLQRGRRGRGKK